MHYRPRQWTLRLTAVAAAAMASAAVITPAMAVECSSSLLGGTCAEGTSVATTFGFLSRPVDRPAFYHLEIDMSGGDFGAVAWGVDENGNEVTQFEAVVADQDPTPGQFAGVPYSDLFGGNDSRLVDEEAEFSYPLDIVATIIIVI